MSEKDCARARAEGALTNFIAAMKQEMVDKGRSAEYVDTFWEALEDEMLETSIYNRLTD